MLLGVLRCADPTCLEEFTEDTSMWNLTTDAALVGWMLVDEDIAYCPRHSSEHNPLAERWVVGCFTCGFEEEYDSEEDAKSEHSFHECESDTWIWSPEEVLRREVNKRARREQQALRTVQVRSSTEEALATAQQIEIYAQRWVRLHNFLRPWRKIHITSKETP